MRDKLQTLYFRPMSVVNEKLPKREHSPEQKYEMRRETPAISGYYQTKDDISTLSADFEAEPGPRPT
jgi:hypothetical protein